MTISCEMAAKLAHDSDVSVFGSWSAIDLSFRPFVNGDWVTVVFGVDGTPSDRVIQLLSRASEREQCYVCFAKPVGLGDPVIVANTRPQFEALYRQAWALPGYRMCTPSRAWGTVISVQQGFGVAGGAREFFSPLVDESGGFDKFKKAFFEELGGVGYGNVGTSYATSVLLPLFRL